MPIHVELSRRPARDLRALPRRDQARLTRTLQENPTTDPPSRNLDLVALQGRPPWLRLRSGDWRVLLRSLSATELANVAGTPERGLLVAMIVNRRDLERAVVTLPRTN